MIQGVLTISTFYSTEFARNMHLVVTATCQKTCKLSSDLSKFRIHRCPQIHHINRIYHLHPNSIRTIPLPTQQPNSVTSTFFHFFIIKFTGEISICIMIHFLMTFLMSFFCSCVSIVIDTVITQILNPFHPDCVFTQGFWINFLLLLFLNYVPISPHTTTKIVFLKGKCYHFH